MTIDDAKDLDAAITRALDVAGVPEKARNDFGEVLRRWLLRMGRYSSVIPSSRDVTQAEINNAVSPLTSEEIEICPYCNTVFKPTCLQKDGGIYPYCSLGCRRLSEEKHVAYEAKHIEITEQLEREMAEAQTRSTEMADALTDLPEGVAERLKEFFFGWIRLPGHMRDVIALRFCGLSYTAIGGMTGVSVQAAHKAAVEAATKNVIIDAATGLARERDDKNQMTLALN